MSEQGKCEDLRLAGSRVRIKGKFFVLDDEKFYIKGITYGTFQPNTEGFQFPEPQVVEKDFAMMAQYGFNAIRIYTIPPLWLLDKAWQYGLRIMLGMWWEQNIAFLDEPKKAKDIIQQVKENILACNRHPAIFCYVIGNEIPAPIARWHGKKKIEHFIKRLYQAVKETDPDCLVTYVNYPTTEYLDLSFLDFYSYNVYLETPDALNAYLSRLQTLSGNKPLVLAETGLDSFRNGKEHQAETLEWQIASIFKKGSAGLFVFSWTDDWWCGGTAIKDWDFGVVDRQRNPKPSLYAVSEAMRKVPFIDEKKLPSISVIVCTRNGSHTIRDTLDALSKLAYPNYDVLVVNDGSTDHIPEIVQEYPVKLLSTPNRGLSNARNTGWMETKGDIVAYIDDDAYPDEHWLLYLAYAFMYSECSAIGGPNLAPDNDGRIARCVANAPGGPVHVLISDEIAEHIPGCNMTFRREVLAELGGFDPTFRVAGDDVDICWRIQKAGHTIGFHPSALVWHHRRNSIKAYWNQQKGYGKAEAMLKAKWPEKYNQLGHVMWKGRLYGSGLILPLSLRKQKIHYGMWGTAPFQSIYQPADKSPFFFFALLPEWYFLLLVVALLASLGKWWPPLLWTWILFAVAFLLVLIQAAVNVLKNQYLPVSIKYKRKYRLAIIFLYMLQPIARLFGRFSYGLTPWQKTRVPTGVGLQFSFYPKKLTWWSDKWRSKEDWLMKIEKKLLSYGLRVKRGGEFDSWDFEVLEGLFASIKALLVVEEHGEGKQYLKMKLRLQPSALALVVFIYLLLMIIGAGLDKVYIAAIIPGALLLILCIDYLRSGGVVVYCFQKIFVHFGAIKKMPLKKHKKQLINVTQGNGVEKGAGFNTINTGKSNGNGSINQEHLT